MGTLYNTISSLCGQRGITGYKLCKDLGISPSIITDLKNGRRAGLNATTADKIASYFGVSVAYLLGTEAKEKPADNGGPMSDDELKFALWGDKEIDDAVLQQVKDFARFALDQKLKSE